MKVLKIVPDTIVDGIGLRTSVYFSGCNIHCDGCHNPESWNFSRGEDYSSLELFNAIDKIGNNKVTLTGGNPLDMEDLYPLKCLYFLLKEKNYNIWLYSGYTYEEILEGKIVNNSRNLRNLLYILFNTDVLVDGPYNKNLKDLSPPFRGSSNQRLINVPESLKQDKVVLFDM